MKLSDLLAASLVHRWRSAEPQNPKCEHWRKALIHRSKNPQQQEIDQMQQWQQAWYGQ